MYMSNANVTIRMDEDLKREADQLFSDLGMSFTTAVNIFTKQAVRERRIPFDITAAPTDPVDAAMSFAERYADDFTRLAQ